MDCGHNTHSSPVDEHKVICLEFDKTETVLGLKSIEKNSKIVATNSIFESRTIESEISLTLVRVTATTTTKLDGRSNSFVSGVFHRNSVRYQLHPHSYLLLTKFLVFKLNPSALETTN